MMDNIPDALYFKDLNSRFIKTNNAHAKGRWLKLKDPDEAIGKTDFDFFAKEHAQQAYENEQEIIRTGKALTNIDEKETWPDGTVTWVSTTKMPLRDKDCRIIGTFGISRDITSRKELEEEREKLIKELQGALAHIRTLNGLLPICARCKKIRDDDGYWQQVEVYVQNHSGAEFTHAYCPDCTKKVLSELNENH
jgi:PAS domain S-box-containing protein